MSDLKKIVFIFYLLPMVVFAQTSVKVTIGSPTLSIGEQTDIELEILQPRNTKTIFPIIEDTIVSGLEVLKISHDTVNFDDMEKISTAVTVTAFDSADYHIPPFVFICGTDTLKTDSLKLTVLPVAVDTLTQNLYDIKDVYGLPKDYTQLIVLIALILLFIMGAIFLFIYLKRRKKKMPQVIVTVEEKIVEINPKEEAVKALQQIEKDRIWQQGKVKEYYTDITQVLRLYIERTEDILALEMTTDEILFELKTRINAELFLRLKNLLTIADLVKFAKFVPEERDFEEALKGAFGFVGSGDLKK